MPGRGGDTRPRKGQDVTVRLKAALEDGSVVEENPALTFTLGDCDVVQVRAPSVCAGQDRGILIYGLEAAPLPLLSFPPRDVVPFRLWTCACSSWKWERRL